MKDPYPSAENWIKDLLNMALPIKAEQDLVLLTASLSHPKTATSLLILIHQRADRMKKNHRKLPKLITWITALSNSVKL